MDRGAERKRARDEASRFLVRAVGRETSISTTGGEQHRSFKDRDVEGGRRLAKASVERGNWQGSSQGDLEVGRVIYGKVVCPRQ